MPVPFSPKSVIPKLKAFWYISIFSLCMVALSGVASYFLLLTPANEDNPLAVYGVYYEETHGQDYSFETIQFFWNKDKRTIEGPVIAGDDLKVRYLRVDSKQVPKIFVVSGDDPTERATLELNFNNPSKPEFEIVENHALKIDYAPRDYHWL